MELSSYILVEKLVELFLLVIYRKKFEAIDKMLKLSLKKVFGNFRFKIHFSLLSKKYIYLIQDVNHKLLIG